MKPFIYYPAALAVGRASREGKGIPGLVQEWHLSITAPSRESKATITLASMESRDVAPRSVALAYMRLMFGMFGLTLILALLSKLVGKEAFGFMAFLTCAVTAFALVLQVKRHVASNQLEKFRLMLPDERRTVHVSRACNPSHIDLFLAIPGFLLFVSIWWGR